MPRSPEWTDEMKHMLVGLKDSGKYDWDIIAMQVGRSKMSCSCMYQAIKNRQQHLTLTVNQPPRATPDYSMGEHKGRD